MASGVVFDAAMASYGPNEASPGLEQLGVCAKLDEGPCVGKIGRLCVEKGLL